MTPARAAWITAAVISGGVSLVVLVATTDNPIEDGGRILQFVFAMSLLGAPLAVAGAVIAHIFVGASHGRDLPERLLRLATAGLRGSRDEWGAAMRAELESIEDPKERRSFAIGCTMTALRTGTGRGPWVIAICVGIAFAAGVFVVSRASLAGNRGGIMGFTLAWPPIVLFVLAFVTSLRTRSFRTGLASGVLALLAGLVAMLPVAMVEAAHWQDVAGIFLMDGDPPKEGGLGRLEAILDPVSPAFLGAYLLLWAPWPVLGAAAGSWRRHSQMMGPVRHQE
jgi:hypothetical protein